MTKGKLHFREPGSQAEIQGGEWGESALRTMEPWAGFWFLKTKGTLTVLLMKGSANPRTQVSMYIFICVYKYGET